ncbi:hypothetical protein BB12_16995 [Salmonella enterica subsp. diarizonae]|uniref:Uncharacterized protein n=2 Tax=Salmonella enterica TaxID=28901 RepID=A0A627XCG2_SALDZ|nr:hypothetical protein [Salmonella enterica]EBP4182633.1 hypothetical protein [Salmonella enterica subsp. diarizonae]ECI2309985.1 hypothetical protein [Salmonella enterica subsp. enterica serovar Infantis]EDX6464615.1 hypothetical protein [Salmonella enterica subsp. diarizonae serovar 60:r:e,n,x,z15]EED4925596.1 hypothetical protein [Salmonella enterica subsp. arizonae]EEG5997893.1 hypothetical protein [Salmonella enterica subsp. enterica]RIP93030.1 hypothetical protein DLN00_25770 [Salmonel
MRRHAEPFRYFSNRIAPLGDLADSLFLKFRGKTWCAHRLLLCSNYRADLSTGSGALQLKLKSIVYSNPLLKRQIGKYKNLPDTPEHNYLNQ